MAWTDDRVEILTKLWGEGLSASQIARELGDVTRNAVIGKVHRLGLAGRASPTMPKSRVRHREPSNFSSNFDTKDRFSENISPLRPFAYFLCKHKNIYWFTICTYGWFRGGERTNIF